MKRKVQKNNMKLLLMVTAFVNMYKVKWENYRFEIDLYDNVNEYFDLPEPFLYDEKGNIVNTPYYIEKGVNRTSLSVVNSRHVKEFNIDYRVTFYLLNITSEQTITFSIKDNEAPLFLKIPEIKVPVKTKLLTEKELLSNVLVKDNYYDEVDLIVSVNNLLSVNINKVGIYKVTFEVFDPSNNVTKVEVDYEVYNNSPPEIKYNEPIILNYGEEFNIYKIFKFNDNFDTNIEVFYDITKVNFTVLGTYPITVSAKNNGDLVTTINTEITIIDKEKPVLIIDNNINIFNVYDFDEKDLIKLITKVSDNYDNLTVDDVFIHSQVDSNNLSKYKVLYEVTDSSLNTVSKEITIEIKDLEKPQINQIRELEISVFNESIYWINYFKFTDNYSFQNELEIKFNDKNINLSKIGTYSLEVEVSDLSKNKTKNTFTVNVIDITSPEVTQVNEIIITDFIEKKNEEYKKYFTITDNYDDYQNIKIELNKNIDYSKTGEYEVMFSFKDLSYNTITIETSIYILDIIPPIINLTKNSITLNLFDEKIDPFSLISDYSDNYSVNENLVIKIMDNVLYDKIGNYYIEYIIIDESLNETITLVNVVVDQKYEKMITGSDITKNIDGIVRNKEGIILSKDVVKYDRYPENIDTSKAGTKEILHVAYNQRGQKEEYIQIITVNENKEIDYSKYKYIFILNGLSVITLMYFVKSSKSKSNFFDKQE